MDWNAVRRSLRGPGALISSIFTDDFELKPQAIEANVRSMVSRGFGSTGGFLLAPCGDGEYVTLTPEENGAVVAAARARRPTASFPSSLASIRRISGWRRAPPRPRGRPARSP